MNQKINTKTKVDSKRNNNAYWCIIISIIFLLEKTKTKNETHIFSFLFFFVSLSFHSVMLWLFLTLCLFDIIYTFLFAFGSILFSFLIWFKYFVVCFGKKKEFKNNFVITICCHFNLKFFHWFLELSSLIHARPIHENLDLNMQSALLIANAGLLRLRQRGARLIAFHLINLAYHFCLLGYFLWIRQTPSMRLYSDYIHRFFPNYVELLFILNYFSF